MTRFIVVARDQAGKTSLALGAPYEFNEEIPRGYTQEEALTALQVLQGLGVDAHIVPLQGFNPDAGVAKALTPVVVENPVSVAPVAIPESGEIPGEVHGPKPKTKRRQSDSVKRGLKAVLKQYLLDNGNTTSAEFKEAHPEYAKKSSSVSSALATLASEGFVKRVGKEPNPGRGKALFRYALVDSPTREEVQAVEPVARSEDSLEPVNKDADRALLAQSALVRAFLYRLARDGEREGGELLDLTCRDKKERALALQVLQAMWRNGLVGRRGGKADGVWMYRLTERGVEKRRSEGWV